MNNISREDAVAELLTLTCEVNEWGDKKYYNKEGELHRIYGPAFICKDGREAWYKNDILHREDGPAIVWSSNRKYYFINNEQLTKEQFIQWQKDNGK